MIEIHLPETQYMVATTHRIPEGESGRHYALNCHCHPEYQITDVMPEGWHVYNADGSEVRGRLVTHRRTLATNMEIHIPWEDQ